MSSSFFLTISVYSYLFHLIYSPSTSLCDLSVNVYFYNICKQTDLLQRRRTTVCVFCSTGREIDMSARAPLWEVGLEYRHGTGHGIGSYLSVHEGRGCFYIQSVLSEHGIYSLEPVKLLSTPSHTHTSAYIHTSHIYFLSPHTHRRTHAPSYTRPRTHARNHTHARFERWNHLSARVFNKIK